MATLYEEISMISVTGPTACPTTTNPASGNWNPYTGSIIGRPGNLDYNSNRYVISEGLVEIFDHSASAFGYTPYNQGGFRIMVPTSSPDALKMCSAIAEVIGCGVEDNGLSNAAADTAMRAKRLLMQCGPTCNVAQYLLAREGFTCRQVHFLNVSDVPNSNDFDEGHTTMEVMVGGVWKLFEIPNDCIILDASNNQLSAKDIITIGMANCHAQRIASTEVGKGGEDIPGPALFSYRAYWDMNLSTDALLQAWHTRIFQILAIQHPTLNQVWARDPGNLTSAQQAYVASCGYTLVAASSFDPVFYP